MEDAYLDWSFGWRLGGYILLEIPYGARAFALKTADTDLTTTCAHGDGIARSFMLPMCILTGSTTMPLLLQTARVSCCTLTVSRNQVISVHLLHHTLADTVNPGSCIPPRARDSQRTVFCLYQQGQGSASRAASSCRRAEKSRCQGESSGRDCRTAAVT
jgi:hypothetical protein